MIMMMMTMAPKSQMSSSFVLDPKGGCFLCLKEIPNSLQNISVLLPESNNSSILSFKLLARHLKLDVGKVLGTTTAALNDDGTPPPLLDPIGNEVAIPLCTGCVDLTGKFSELYRRLDRLRLEVDAAVRKLHGVMVGADRDEELVFQYRQRVLAEESASLGDGALRALSDSLRKEVLQKCSSAAKRATPRVELCQLETNCGKAKERRHRHLRNDQTESRRRRFAEEADTNDFHQQQEGSIKKKKIEPAIAGAPPTPATKDVVRPSSTSLGKIPLAKFRMEQDEACSTEALETRRSETQQPPGKLAHRVGKSEFKCNLCIRAKPFNTAAHLWYHKATTHRTTFFLKYNKDPKRSSAQFEQILERLFKDLDLRKERNGNWRCRFCKTFQSQRGQSHIIVQNHWIRDHMDQLVPRLMELQKKVPDDEEDLGRVKSKSLPAHKPAHYRHKGRKGSLSFKCNLCVKSSSKSKPFRNSSHLWYHKATKHRSTFFLKYKDPSLPLDQFEKVVVKLFNGLDLPKPRRGKYSCCFCQRVSSSQCRHKVLIENHVIREHMEQLVSKLMGLQQQQQILQATEDEDSGGSKKEKTSFKKLRPGRKKKSIKKLTNSSSNPSHHRPSPSTCSPDSSAGKRYNCNLCTKSFTHPSNIRAHKLADHRSLYFAKHKHPKLSQTQFEQVLAKLFSDIEVRRNSSGVYKCGFDKCAQIASQRTRLDNHFVVHHKDKLIPTLMKLQIDTLQLKTKTLGRRRRRVPIPIQSSSNKKPLKSTRPATRAKGLRPAKCQYCNKLFRHRQVVRDHIKAKHRSTFFAQFKDPRLAPAEFEDLVEQLFQLIEVPPAPGPGGGGGGVGGGYKCLFCHPIERSCSTKASTQAHWITAHLDELGSRFVKLQAAHFQPGKKVVSFSCAYCSALFPRPSDVQCHAYNCHGSQLLPEWKHPGISSEEFDRLVYRLFTDELKFRQGNEKGTYECSFCDLQSPNKPDAYCHLLSDHRDEVLEILNKLQDNAMSHLQRPGLLLLQSQRPGGNKMEPMELDMDADWEDEDEASSSSIAGCIIINNKPVADNFGLEVVAASQAQAGSQMKHNISSSISCGLAPPGSSGGFVKLESRRSERERGGVINEDTAEEEEEGEEDDPPLGLGDVSIIIGI